MVLQASQIKLPQEVVSALAGKVKDSSCIAALCPQSPQLFADSTVLVFDGASEAEIVGENVKSASYGQPVRPVVAQRVKIQTTTRVTKELQWADEDAQLQIIEKIQADQARALGRALDYIVFHGVNPKTGEAASGLTGLFSQCKKVEPKQISVKSLDELDDLVDAVGEVYEVNGFALSRKYAGLLRRKVRDSGTVRAFDVPLNLRLSTLEGVPAAVSNTVSGAVLKTKPFVLAACGDFSLIRWGLVRDITAELIPYGDPDQTGVDLSANQQVAYRSSAVLAFSVLDPNGFAVLKEPSPKA